MLNLQKEADRQDNERLYFEALYYPLFVGLYHKIAKYVADNFKNNGNINFINQNNFRNEFKNILTNLYAKTQKDSADNHYKFILDGKITDNIIKRVGKQNIVENVNNINDQLNYIINTNQKEIARYYQDYNDIQDKSLADYISDRIINNANNRSSLIAQQNVGISYESSKNNIANVGSMELGLRAKKKWVTMGDGDVRLIHQEADGQTVDINSFFVVNNELLRYPKDMANGASLGNTMRCRCILLALVR